MIPASNAMHPVFHATAARILSAYVPLVSHARYAILAMCHVFHARTASHRKLPAAPAKCAIPASSAMLPVILVTLNRFLVAHLVIPANSAILATNRAILARTATHRKLPAALANHAIPASCAMRHASRATPAKGLARHARRAS